MPQTAVEQAQLIAEISDNYATATIATGFPELEVEAQQEQASIIELTADLQEHGFLPETYSGLSSPSTGAETGAWTAKAAGTLAKAGKWLAARSKNIGDHIKKHGVLYVLGTTAIYSAHTYLTQDQQTALIHARERTERFKATISKLCEIDPVQCKKDLAKALGDLSKPPMTKTGVPVPLVIGAGALIAFAIYRANR